MKNKSFQYPFPTLNDSFFDKDKSGDLNIVETAFRDASLQEMQRNSKSEVKRDNKIIVKNNSSTNTNDTGKIFAVVAVAISLVIIIIWVLLH